MKRKILVILVTFVNIFALAGNIFLRLNPKPVEINNCKVKSGMLSMMLETDTNSKTYIQSTSNDWPTDGYMFNEEMSKCERGSTLKWDDTNKKIVMEGNSSDKCYVFFDKYNPAVINKISILVSSNKMTINVDISSGTAAIAKYYYSKDDGVSYVESDSNSYTFTNLDKGTYNVKVYVVDTNGKKSEVKSGTADVVSTLFSQYIKSLYTGVQGSNNIYYHTSSLKNSAGDDSYRYAGADPNNYVCFGSTSSPCPDDNLYRVIGVFDGQVKLVKYDYANDTQLGTNGDYYSSSYLSSTYNTYKGSNLYLYRYYFNYKYANTLSSDWTTSFLNTINLNTNFYNSLSSNFSSMIATSTWYLNTSLNVQQTPYSIVREEKGSSATTYSAKIGLLYVSDYGYSADLSAWTTSMGNASNGYNLASITSVNWLYMGLDEWTLNGGRIYANGGLNEIGSLKIDAAAWDVRPVFYLDASVPYNSGSGSKSDPFYIIKLR